MAWDANQFSLADFYFSDSDNPLKPPADYLAWRRDTAWATSLYEPVLCDPGRARPTDCRRRRARCRSST